MGKQGLRATLAPDWYETGLAPRERKQRGHFSTPHSLVDQVLDACGYTATADLCHLRVLDPACGSGNFLARAARRLAQALRARNLDEAEISACTRRNLWGLDPDPAACCLAELQVRAVLGTTCGIPPASSPLHIHQADSLALPWQPCVDLLVANPPYLATKNTDLRQYYRTERRGQTDSYLLFLELALRVVRPGGWIGLVLPDPVLARTNATSARSRLLRECTLQHIWHLSDVFAAEVGAVVLIAQKTPPHPLHRIHWTRTRWRPGQELTTPAAHPSRVSQALLTDQPGAELRYLLGHAQGHTSERLRRILHAGDDPRLLPLETLADIKRGEEIGRASDLLRPLETLADGLPVLRGGIDLRPYALSPGGLGIERAVLKKPVERYIQPKLLVVKSTAYLQAALDTGGHVVLQTLYLLRVREQDCEQEIAYFLLALLNSRLLRAYVYHLHTAYKLIQPQIEQAVLARLPVAWGDARARREIAERSRMLVRACGAGGPVVEWDEQENVLYEEQERAINALYSAVMSENLRETDKGVFIDG